MYLLAKDTVNGAEGKVFVTRDEKQIEVAGMMNITTYAEIQGKEMRVVGTRTIQNKANGAKQTGKGNIYYGTSLWTDMVLEYINTGNMPQFDLQITNDDPSSSVGSQSIAYYGCELTGSIPLSILDSEEAMLNYEFNFTYTRVAKLRSFNEPASYGG
ncbi:phage tail tube protein [Anaerotignum sp.]|uniref:phage tail tube protein n=1 Tax=Anaerotignum sp. TaxID=2039241 RepID=UPI003A85CF30